LSLPKAKAKSLPDCPFCEDRLAGQIVDAYGYAVAILDRYPVTPGHHLVISRRHEDDYLQLSTAERNDIDHLIRILKDKIEKEDPTVTGFNMGVNIGESAGQTVFHVHMHLIPRRDGDTPEPRGGVRGVIPGKRSY
jgi:diadenosine tetraphosphate (Ap4A) HIT family hydrolase